MENETAQTEKVTTRSIGVKFGLYGALCRVLLFAVAIAFGINAFDGPISWIGLVVGIVVIVLAHIQFKKDGDGHMEYGQGVGISFWTGLIGVLIGVPVMYIYLTFVDSAPFDMFLAQQEEKMIAGGAPQQAIDMGLSWTKKLFWPMAIIGGLIGSVIIGLIVSIFTKKSAPEMPI